MRCDAHPRGRRRARRARRRRPGIAPGGARGGARRGRARRARRRRGGSARRGRARPAHAVRRRPGGLPPAARRGRSHAGARADGARRHRRSRARARRRRRRLPGQAVRARGAARARARSAPPHGRRRRGRHRGDGPAVRGPGARPRRLHGPARRAPDRADAHRVRAARAVPTPPAPGADALDHLRSRLGLRLRPRVELARGLRRLPAAQDRGGRGAAAPPHGARRRLRAALAMSLRRRLTLACAAAVALAVVLAAGLTYWFVRDALRDQIDASLRDAKPFSVDLAPEAADRVQRIVGARLEASSPLDGPVLFAQALGPGGRIEVPPGEEPVQLLPAADLEAVAAGEREQFFADVELAGRHLRVYTAPTPGGGALQVARSLDEVDGTLGTLRIGLAAVALLGVVAALALARLATRTAVKPVAELTDAAEHVARTRDLTRRIERAGDDELSRLAGAFNTMLEALDA